MRILFFLLSVWSIGLAAAGSFAVRYVDVGPKTASAFQGTTCCLASDSAGNQYVVGTIVSRFDLAFGDPSAVDTDVSVTKLDRDLEVVYQLRFGGSGSDSAGGSVVDQEGNLFITGTSWDDFPSLNSLFLTPKAGQVSAFVVKIDGASGCMLLLRESVARPQLG